MSNCDIVKVGNYPIDVIRELINSGVDINTEDNSGLTFLHYACAHGNIDCVIELLNLGANPDIRDVDGWTPLHYATANVKIDCVRELLNYGVNTDIKDNKGQKASDLYDINEYIEWRKIIDEFSRPIMKF